MLLFSILLKILTYCDIMGLNLGGIMIGNKLKELRKKCGLTQKAFAKLFGVSGGTVAMWETNRRQPDYHTLCKIADYFNVTTDYLLNRECYKDFNLEGYELLSKKNKEKVEDYVHDLIELECYHYIKQVVEEDNQDEELVSAAEPMIAYGVEAENNISELEQYQKIKQILDSYKLSTFVASEAEPYHSLDDLERIRAIKKILERENK